MEIMKLRISESIEYDSEDESPGDPLGFNIGDIENNPHPENTEPLPSASGEKGTGAIPFQYERLDLDREGLGAKANSRWTEERETFIGEWDEVAGLFSDILAVRVIRKSSGYVREGSSSNDPGHVRKEDIPENHLKRIKRTFGEVKDLFRVFGVKSQSTREFCPARNV